MRNACAQWASLIRSGVGGAAGSGRCDSFGLPKRCAKRTSYAGKLTPEPRISFGSPSSWATRLACAACSPDSGRGRRAGTEHAIIGRRSYLTLRLEPPGKYATNKAAVKTTRERSIVRSPPGKRHDSKPSSVVQTDRAGASARPASRSATLSGHAPLTPSRTPAPWSRVARARAARARGAAVSSLPSTSGVEQRNLPSRISATPQRRAARPSGTPTRWVHRREP